MVKKTTKDHLEWKKFREFTQLCKHFFLSQLEKNHVTQFATAKNYSTGREHTWRDRKWFTILVLRNSVTCKGKYFLQSSINRNISKISFKFNQSRLNFSNNNFSWILWSASETLFIKQNISTQDFSKEIIMHTSNSKSFQKVEIHIIKLK